MHIFQNTYSQMPPLLVALAMAAFAVIVGVAAVLGWVCNVPWLTDWPQQGISMFVNAGLCALLGGAALAALVMGSNGGRQLDLLNASIEQRPSVDTSVIAARVLAGIVVAICSLTLFQHFTGVNLGIDTWLVRRDWGQAAAAAPMRMGIPASTAFLLLGIAIILATLGPMYRLAASSLAVVSAAIALLSITGYWFGANQLFGVAKYTGIALQTSLCMAALSVGLMAALPEVGLVAALRRDDAGGAMLRRLIVPIVLLPLVLGWLRIIGQQQGLYDANFGTAIRTIAEIILFFGLLWWTANDISRHVSAARKAQARLAAIVESSDDAIVSKSLDGIIQSWNVGAESTFGYTAAEAVGQHISLIIPPERIDEETHIISRLRRGERIEHFDTVRMRKDGTRFNISLTVSPLRDAEGRVIGASKIARDISDRIRVETELRQLALERERLLRSEQHARSEAERASQLKDEFLATLSHELRTPLNAILGWSQLLTHSSAPGDLEQGIDAIQRNARAQAQLIEDLLDMSRIISGKVRLDVQAVDLAAVIQAAIESISPAADAKGIRVQKVLDPRAGFVSGDPTRLQQVIWNLLTNAIKFTPKGGKVDVILGRVNSHVEITVHDTGIGIDAEHLPIIFERFRQVDSSTTRSHGGLGLGLSIVKHLIELHGGSIVAKSEGEGRGSTFVISLPLAPVRSDGERLHPTTAGHTTFEHAEINLHGVRVLVVDDEPDARALIERALSMCGAEVQAAGSAAQAMDALSQFRPHVLVSDIGMPGTDGYQFIRDVRNLKENEGGRTPAIALTAFARSEDRMRAMMAGYQVHVAKPIEPQELAVTVRSLYRGVATLN